MILHRKVKGVLKPGSFRSRQTYYVVTLPQGQGPVTPLGSEKRWWQCWGGTNSVLSPGYQMLPHISNKLARSHDPAGHISSPPAFTVGFETRDLRQPVIYRIPLKTSLWIIHTLLMSIKHFFPSMWAWPGDRRPLAPTKLEEGLLSLHNYLMSLARALP